MFCFMYVKSYHFSNELICGAKECFGLKCAVWDFGEFNILLYILLSKNILVG